MVVTSSVTDSDAHNLVDRTGPRLNRAVVRPRTGLRHRAAFWGLSARFGNGVHISDHRLAALIHMHMLDADGLRATVPQAT